jgi:hypothetical protein
LAGASVEPNYGGIWSCENQSANQKIRRGEENATLLKRHLRLSKKHRETSSLRRAARLNAILGQVAEDKHSEVREFQARMTIDLNALKNLGK